MKVLMLGWEFPPYFAGGVGIVCRALTQALARQGTEVTYLMPSGPEQVSADHLRLLVASRIAPGISVARLPSLLRSYAAEHGLAASMGTAGGSGEGGALYGTRLLEEMERFAAQAVAVAEHLDLDYDVIHAHDWTTFPAGLALRRRSGKPLLVHVHITEYDKTGGRGADPEVWAYEKAGMDGADCVVAVSDLVRRRLVESYFVAPHKIRVVHNGVELDGRPALLDGRSRPVSHLPSGDKVVLFLGRVTLQKGPDYFVEAARRVLDRRDDVTFVLAGAGDMLGRMIERSAELGLGRKMLFAGFVDREQAKALYERADLFVMPSVSEPFGIVPLEAMERGAPVILSRQSGVSEVVRHALKVDFWDVDDLAAKMIAALSYPTLCRELRLQGRREVEGMDWDRVASTMLEVYRDLEPRSSVA